MLAAVGCGSSGTGSEDAGVERGDDSALTGVTVPEGGTSTSNPPVDAEALVDPPRCAEQGCEALSMGNWTSLPGYLGPLGDAAEESPRVDPASVRASGSGTWSAIGLVVNGASARSDAATVTAELLAEDGTVLGRVEGVAPVAPLRPGEPSPFLIGSDIEAAKVAEVRWGVSGPSGDVPTADEVSARRSIQFSVYWTHPFTSEDTMEPVGHELEGASAHIVYGSIQSTDVVEAPMVAAAWMDDDGRLLAFLEVPAYRAGTDDAVDRLDPSSNADLVVIVTDPEMAPSLQERQPILWGYPR